MGKRDNVEQTANVDNGTIVIQSGGDIVINGGSTAADEIRIGDDGVWIDGKKVV